MHREAKENLSTSEYLDSLSRMAGLYPPGHALFVRHPSASRTAKPVGFHPTAPSSEGIRLKIVFLAYYISGHLSFRMKDL